MAGFRIEQVIEDVCKQEEILEKHVNGWYSREKARAIPTALIMKSTKL